MVARQPDVSFGPFLFGRGLAVACDGRYPRRMNEDANSATEIYAHHMLVAMQRAAEDLLDPARSDVHALPGLYRPGTELRRAVCEYVAHLKGAGMPPERVLVLVKQSVFQFESIPLQIETRALTEGVISLCIEEYYRT
jgi:hypothetical protein